MLRGKWRTPKLDTLAKNGDGRAQGLVGGSGNHWVPAKFVTQIKKIL